MAKSKKKTGRRVRRDLNAQVRRALLSQMEEQDLNKNRLSQLMGLTPQTVGEYFEVGHNFTVETIERIAKTLNCKFTFEMEE